ncbi:uncharacterized protein LOC115193552 [Salmo trutta]|uniref:uncharacterized protein LOC115193552 n=1 Tax=Salmo trutta TaxID=8032 RepID=UPI001132599A|nr:uncharacterized protein LOC115193552 [Salmo trutta]
MDVKIEDDEAERSQVTIWSDSINACMDYPHSPVSGNTEASYLETKTDSTYEHDYTVIQTTNNLSDSYFLSEIDVKLEENNMGISPTVPWSSCSYVGLPKEHSHVSSISSQTTSQGQILRLFPEKTGTRDGENNAVKVVYFCNAQDPISTSEGHFLKEESWHGSPSSDIPIANVFTLCGSFEGQINPSSQVFSVNQTQTNNELPLPAENVHLASHSTDTSSVLTSPATESGCNLAVSTRPRPILSDYCEPFNFPSDEDEDEDYNGDGRRRLQCQKTVEDEYIRQCRVSYSRKKPRHFGNYWKAPYAKCKEMGVNFNVGSGAKQKLDFHLLTNGVMLEVSEYAKEINRAHQHVIYDILEYNFDLGVGNEVRYDFSSRTMSKLNGMKKSYKRTRPEWLAEVFELPDPKTMKARAYSLKWARSNLHNRISENRTPFDVCIKEEPVVDLISPPHVKTESLFTETDVARCADETALLGPENGPNEIWTKDEADLDVIYPQHVQTETVFTQKDITMKQSLMMPTIEEALEYLYPLCKEKGLDLDVKSKSVKKEKLDLHLLTRDIMLELADFASDVCGNYKQIVCDVLDQNFDLGLEGGKTVLADDIMGALSVLKAKSHLQGQKRCQLHKDTFMKKRRKRKYPAEICRNQNFTPASLRRKYRRLKEVTKRRRLGLMRKKREMDTLIARVSKGGNLLEVRQVEPHWVKLESISDKIDLALCADETKLIVTNLDQSYVKFNTHGCKSATRSFMKSVWTLMLHPNL